MSTAANLRFLFDKDFAQADTPAAPEPEEVFEPKVDNERIAREKAQADAVAAAAASADAAGYARGLAEANEAAATREDARLNMLLERLDAQLGALAADAQARVAEIEETAAGLGVQAARKLAPALVASQPETEIAAFFARAIKDFIEAPKIDVRLNPEDIERAGALLRKLGAAGGYEGQVRIRADDGLGQGDCVVSWGDGGARREMADVDGQLADMLAEHFDWGNRTR